VEEPEFDAPTQKPVSAPDIPVAGSGQDDSEWRRLGAVLGHHEAYAQLFAFLTAVAGGDADQTSLALWRVEAEREELGAVMSWRVRWLQEGFEGKACSATNWHRLRPEFREHCMAAIAQGFDRRLLELSFAHWVGGRL
jgi:hypothetical protein